MKNNYDIPDEDGMAITFGNEDSKVPLIYRQVHVYKKAQKVFVPLGLFGQKVFLCASFDNVAVYSREKGGELFVDSQWLLDEKLVDQEGIDAILKMRSQVLAKSDV
jgi:hypothetical protein